MNGYKQAHLAYQPRRPCKEDSRKPMSAAEKDLDLRAVLARASPSPLLLLQPPATADITSPLLGMRAEVGLLLGSALRISGRVRGSGLGGPSPVAAGPHDVARDGGAVVSGEEATILLLLRRMPRVPLSPLRRPREVQSGWTASVSAEVWNRPPLPLWARILGLYNVGGGALLGHNNREQHFIYPQGLGIQPSPVTLQGTNSQPCSTRANKPASTTMFPLTDLSFSAAVTPFAVSRKPMSAADIGLPAEADPAAADGPADGLSLSHPTALKLTRPGRPEVAAVVRGEGGGPA